MWWSNKHAACCSTPCVRCEEKDPVARDTILVNACAQCAQPCQFIAATVSHNASKARDRNMLSTVCATCTSAHASPLL